jgi:ABC-type glycerol-3-phosphate transport system substrate-binding protein
MPSRQVWLILVSFLFFSVLVILKTMDVASPINNSNSEDTQAVVSASQSETAQSHTEIKVAVSFSANEFAVLQQLKTQYEAVHPGITITVENVAASEAYQIWKKQSQLGEAPDIMLLDNGWVNEFAALGYLYPVDEFFTTEQQLLQFEPILAQNKWNGYIWGVPKEIDPYILVYNKKRISESPLGRPPQSADELVALQKAISNPAEGLLGLQLPPKDARAFFSFLWSMGGATHHPLQSQKQELSLNQSINQQVLELFFGVNAEEGKADSPTNESGNTKPAALRMVSPYASVAPWIDVAKGKTAMLIAPYSDYRQNMSNEIGWIKLPSVKEGVGSGGLLKGRSFVVSSRSTVQKEAYEWIRRMTDLESQVKLWSAGGAGPAQLSAYKTELLQQDPDYKQLVQSIESGRAFPAEPDLPQKMALLGAQLDKLWGGKEPLSKLLEGMDKQWGVSNRTKLVQ